MRKTTKDHICTWVSPPMWFLCSKASHFSELSCSGLFTRTTCLSLNTTKDCRRFVSLSAASVDKYITGALAFSTIRRMHSAAWGMGKKQLSFFTLLQEHQEKISQMSHSNIINRVNCKWCTDHKDLTSNSTTHSPEYVLNVVSNQANIQIPTIFFLCVLGTSIIPF